MILKTKAKLVKTGKRGRAIYINKIINELLKVDEVELKSELNIEIDIKSRSFTVYVGEGVKNEK